MRVQTSEPKHEGAPVKTEIPEQEGLTQEGRKAARLSGPSKTYTEIQDEPSEVSQQQSPAPAVVLQKPTMADAHLQTDLNVTTTPPLPVQQPPLTPQMMPPGLSSSSAQPQVSPSLADTSAAGTIPFGSLPPASEQLPSQAGQAGNITITMDAIPT